jgi:hypothetical protein
LELPNVFKITLPTKTPLALDKVSERQDSTWNALLDSEGRASKGLLEIQARYAGEELRVEAVDRHLSMRPRKPLNLRPHQVHMHRQERPRHALSIRLRWGNPQIKVFRRAQVTMKDDRVATDYQVACFASAER